MEELVQGGLIQRQVLQDTNKPLLPSYLQWGFPCHCPKDSPKSWDRPLPGTGINAVESCSNTTRAGTRETCGTGTWKTAWIEPQQFGVGWVGLAVNHSSTTRAVTALTLPFLGSVLGQEVWQCLLHDKSSHRDREVLPRSTSPGG